MAATRSPARSARAKSRASQAAPGLQVPQVGAPPRGPKASPVTEGGSAPNPRPPLVGRVLAGILTAAAKSWGKVLVPTDDPAKGAARGAIASALLALVRLLTAWGTPEGAALTRAAYALGEVPHRKLAPVAVEPTEPTAEQLVAALEASPSPMVVTFLRVDDAGRTWALGPSDLYREGARPIVCWWSDDPGTLARRMTYAANRRPVEAGRAPSALDNEVEELVTIIREHLPEDLESAVTFGDLARRRPLAIGLRILASTARDFMLHQGEGNEVLVTALDAYSRRIRARLEALDPPPAVDESKRTSALVGISLGQTRPAAEKPSALDAIIARAATDPELRAMLTEGLDRPRFRAMVMDGNMVYTGPTAEGETRHAVAFRMTSDPAQLAVNVTEALDFSADLLERLRALDASARGPRPFPAALDSWIGDLKVQLADITAAGLDATAPPARRRLGRRTARATIRAAYSKAGDLLALGEGADHAA